MKYHKLAIQQKAKMASFCSIKFLLFSTKESLSNLVIRYSQFQILYFFLPSFFQFYLPKIKKNSILKIQRDVISEINLS